MAETTALPVANYFIRFCREAGDPVSNLKLQKLLYYAQAWYLALRDQPLFPERIEAWVHGPAVPPVYGHFKGWAWQPIGDDVSAPRLSQDLHNHLSQVMRQYGPMSAYQLELLTHREKPWRDARKGLAPDEPSTAVISHQSMKDYYRALARARAQG